MQTLQKVLKNTTPGKILNGSMHVEQEDSMLQIRGCVQTDATQIYQRARVRKGKGRQMAEAQSQGSEGKQQ